MRFARALETLSIAIEKVAAVLLAAITLLIVASAIGRYVFAAPIPDAFDISRFLLGAAILWGFASVGFRGSHIKVDIFAEMMPAGLRRVVDIFAWSVLLVFAALLSWKMWDRVLSAAASGEATFDLRLPAWPMMALIAAGAAVSIVAIVARILIIARGEGGLDAFEDAEASSSLDDTHE
ncbi:TRAP transporter small permease [Mesorhizobium xinjiangense]|uniref:TRAP transporter small permease n=1 Tax=Mesorhizobium xinjiangense TaxID=2678685 RepID=UPI0012EE06EE|nr:TRAP transporter small permease [Mesorhizobium xinjiangense]